MRHCSHLHGEFETQLWVSTCWRLKEIRRKSELPLFGKPQPPARQLETLADELRHRTQGVHAGPEVGVVIAFPAHGPNLRHDMCGALGEMLGQPFAEQVLDLPWQSQHGVARERRTGLPRGLEH